MIHLGPHRLLGPSGAEIRRSRKSCVTGEVINRERCSGRVTRHSYETRITATRAKSPLVGTLRRPEAKKWRSPAFSRKFTFPSTGFSAAKPAVSLPSGHPEIGEESLHLTGQSPRKLGRRKFSIPAPKCFCPSLNDGNQISYYWYKIMQRSPVCVSLSSARAHISTRGGPPFSYPETVPQICQIASSGPRHLSNPKKLSSLTVVQNNAATPGLRHWRPLCRTPRAPKFCRAPAFCPRSSYRPKDSKVLNHWPTPCLGTR